MKMTHGDAVTLEMMVGKVFHCDRYGIGGFVNADIFERYPMEAVAMCVTKLYNGSYDDEIVEFARKWRIVFEYPEENKEETIDNFISEFSALIALLEQ